MSEGDDVKCVLGELSVRNKTAAENAVTKVKREEEKATKRDQKVSSRSWTKLE